MLVKRRRRLRQQSHNESMTVQKLGHSAHFLQRDCGQNSFCLNIRLSRTEGYKTGVIDTWGFQQMMTLRPSLLVIKFRFPGRGVPLEFRLQNKITLFLNVLAHLHGVAVALFHEP